MPSPYVGDSGEITAEGWTKVAVGLSVLTEAIRRNNFAKGWRATDSEPRNVGELCALMHSEVSEAFEAYRDGEEPLWYRYPNGVQSDEPELDGVLGKPEGMAAELADVLIRLLDTADELGWPVIEAALYKHAYNQTRPYRHGGKAC